MEEHFKNEYSRKYCKFILNNPDKNWNWDDISKNPNITMKFILDNPDKDWDWEIISCNPNITMKDISDNPDKDWDWYFISRNPNITIKIILDNPGKNWDWDYICENTFKNDKNNYIKFNLKKILLTYGLKNKNITNLFKK